MKLGLWFATVLLSVSFATASTKKMSIVRTPVNLDLEASGQEYSKLLKKNKLFDLATGDSIDVAIAMGKRNLDWVAFINQSRSDSTKLRLTSASTRYGIPIDSPRKYNPTIIEATRQNLIKNLPSQMQAVLVGGQDFTDKLSVSDEEFVKWSREVDKTYQLAARYKALIPYKSSYIQARQNDVRGYYYLSLEKDLASKLDGFNKLEQADHDRLMGYLVNICFNSSGNEASCSKELQTAMEKQQVKSFFDDYYPNAKVLWDEYFSIGASRTDITWDSSHPETTLIPFQEPPTQALHNFMLNVEDEWHWDKWQLKLDFRSDAAAHLEFEPGVVPHVNDLAGNIITMDENAPIEEYEVRWTIRHEFGHVLGFEDCYVEFYDTKEAAFISYQLDTTDLMCSRAGNMKEHHYLEMKKTYYKN